MRYSVKVGDILYYFTGYNEEIRECTISRVDKDTITVKFKDSFKGQLDKTLLIDAIGKRLFCEKSHIEISFDKFAKLIYNDTNDEKYLAKRKEIKSVLEERNIKDVVHFTNIKNLVSILEHGIIPRKNFMNYGINLIPNSLEINERINDIQRFDYSMDCTSCSLTFPNDKCFKEFRRRRNNDTWVVIILDSEILLSPDNPCEFCLTNASNKHMRAYSGFNGEHLENMFSERFVVQKQNGINYLCHRENFPDNFTTDVQAEVLINGIIDKKYIKKIIFDTELNKENWCNRNYDVFKNYRFETLPKYFGERKDFLV